MDARPAPGRRSARRRVAVAVAQAVAVLVGLLVGNVTYRAWSGPEPGPPPTTVEPRSGAAPG